MRDTEFPERGPGNLDLARVDASLCEAAAVWMAHSIEVCENDILLPAPQIVEVRASLPSDKSFASYEEAFQHVTGPGLTNDVQIYWNQAMLDGVELGPLLVLLVLIPFLHLLFGFAVAERMGTIILSALVAHTGWHWMLDRGEQLRQFRFVWPALTVTLLATAVHWLMFLLVVAAVLWYLATRRSPSRPLAASSPSPSITAPQPHSVEHGLETGLGGEI